MVPSRVEPASDLLNYTLPFVFFLLTVMVAVYKCVIALLRIIIFSIVSSSLLSWHRRYVPFFRVLFYILLRLQTKLYYYICRSRCYFIVTVHPSHRLRIFSFVRRVFFFDSSYFSLFLGLTLHPPARRST